MMFRAQAAHASVKIATAEGAPIRVRGEKAEEHGDGHNKHVVVCFPVQRHV